MIIGPKVASSSVPTMISTPFFAIGPTSTPWIVGIRPMPPRVVQQRLIGQKHLALGRDADAHAADLALVRDVARLDLHDQRKAHAGDRGIEPALLRHQHFVRHRNAGGAQQRLAVELGKRRAISDARRDRAAATPPRRPAAPV